MDTGAHIERLARDGRLQEARRAGEEAVAADPTDDGALSALVNVYLLIERSCIETGVTGYLDEIGVRLDELIPMLNDGGKAASRHVRNMLMQCPDYEKLQSLEVLSARDGHEEEAYRAARAIYDSGAMDRRLHEIYATIIYRYACVAMCDDDSRPVRALLLDYLALVVARPSRTHSLMLRLAVRVAHKFADFVFARFFELWNPATFRSDDFEAGEDGKGSLAAIAVELILDSDQAYELPRLMSLFKVPAAVVLATVREAYGRLIGRQLRQGDMQRAVTLIDLYGRHHAIHGADRHHTLVLKHTLKGMRDERACHFVSFFIEWFNDDVAVADNVELLQRAVDHAFFIVRGDRARYDHLLGRFVDIYDIIAGLEPGGESEVSVRRRALMMSWLDQDNEAIERMSEMAARTNGMPLTVQFWLDFADVVADSRVRAGILALGALRLGLPDGREANEETAMLTRRLKLCAPNGTFAGVEHVDDMSVAAEPLNSYGAVNIGYADTAAAQYELIYHRLAADALAMIYGDVNSVTMSVIEVNERHLIVACGTREPVVIDTMQWPTIRGARPGDNVELKCREGAVVMARMTDGKPFAALKRVPGIVTDRGQLALVRHSQVDKMPPLPEPGTAVMALIYLDGLDTPVVHGFEPEMRRDVVAMFPRVTVTVYESCADSVKFSAGPDLIEGEIAGINTDGLTPGTKLKVSYYVERDRRVTVIDWQRVDDDAPTESTRRVSGRLIIGSDGKATVRDVLVDRQLLDDVGIACDTYVTCDAYHVPPLSWRASSISTY